MRGNPFKSRWRSDDPDFTKQRKKKWPFVKQFHVDRSMSAKELKKLKLFFLEGEWPDGNMPGIGEFLAWTPVETTQDVEALLKYLIVEVRGKDYISMSNIYVATSGGCRVSSNSPVSYALGNEELLSNVVLGKCYTDEIQFSSGEPSAIPRHITPQEFILNYETYIQHFLTSVDPYIYAPVRYSLEFYLSCVHHMEDQDQDQDQTVKHHDNFANIISTAFNFVEGGQGADKATSKVGEYAQLLCERLTQPNTPVSIKQTIDALGPNYLIEYARKTDSNEEVYVLNQYVSVDSLWGVAPFPRVMRGLVHHDAISAFWQAVITSQLLPRDTPMPDINCVDVGGILSGSLVKELGYKPREPVPAYKISVWYQPNVIIANNVGAEFGADLFLLLPKNGVINETTTSVLYYPRLNKYYQDWIPTTVLLLKERQIRRALWEETSKHLFIYYDGIWCVPVADAFMDSPGLDIGFEILCDDDEGDINHSIVGPNTPPWEGEPLPELNLEGALDHADRK
jgi:hypothetical protein